MSSRSELAKELLPTSPDLAMRSSLNKVFRFFRRSTGGGANNGPRTVVPVARLRRSIDAALKLSKKETCKLRCNGMPVLRLFNPAWQLV
jgi:hypothetical protein